MDTVWFATMQPHECEIDVHYAWLPAEIKSVPPGASGQQDARGHWRPRAWLCALEALDPLGVVALPY